MMPDLSQVIIAIPIGVEEHYLVGVRSVAIPEELGLVVALSDRRIRVYDPIIGQKLRENRLGVH